MPSLSCPRRSDELLNLVRQVGVLRSRDLATSGIAREHLRRLVQAGSLKRVERGLYVLSSTNMTEQYPLAEVARRVPKGIVCLMSALAFHHLVPQAPDEVWLAIDHDAHPPRATRWPLHIVRFSGQARLFGIEEHQVEGVVIRVYSPAKTVADCFKYRHKLGQEVALQALRETWHARRATISELWEAAQICRVRSVMRPYLEMLVP